MLLLSFSSAFREMRLFDLHDSFESRLSFIAFVILTTEDFGYFEYRSGVGASINVQIKVRCSFSGLFKLKILSRRVEKEPAGLLFTNLFTKFFIRKHFKIKVSFLTCRRTLEPQNLPGMYQRHL